MRLRSLIPLAVLLVATKSFAAPPPCSLVSPANCTLPGGILMVEGAANAAGAWVPDPIGAFTITLRNALNQTIAGCTVTLDLSNCTEFQFCVGSVPAPVCPGPTFTATTDAAGNAHFDIAGFVLPGTPSNTGTTVPCAKVTAGTNKVFLGTLPLACADLDGSGVVDAADVAVLTTIFNTGLALKRGDYDFSGAIGVPDFSILNGIVAAGGSSKAAPGTCCH